MRYTKEREREENLRAARRVMIDCLAVMKHDDPAIVEVQQRLREVIYELRETLCHRAVDPCSSPECVEAGTVIENGQQWCPIHLPTRFARR
jgi:hypothetical protein